MNPTLALTKLISLGILTLTASEEVKASSVDPNDHHHHTEPNAPSHSEQCHLKASLGECASNPQYMFSMCSSECIHSDFATIVDVIISDEDGRDNNTGEVHVGIKQRIHPDHSNDPYLIKNMFDNIIKTRDYMQNFLKDALKEYLYHETKEMKLGNVFDTDCYNEDPYCQSLAAAGKCIPPEGYDQDEPDNDLDSLLYEFMMRYCAPSCQTCEKLMDTLIYEDRIMDTCTPDRSIDIIQPGDLHRIFERIVEEAKDDKMPYSVNVLSRPLNDDVNDTGHSQHIDRPWIITLDNFLSDEECDRLIELGAIEGYEASGLVEEDYLSQEEWENALNSEDRYRTSTNAWCDSKCYKDPLVEQVLAKIERLTGVPDDYQEWLQLLKYLPGQYYKMHHDGDDEDGDAIEGPRILTVFIYLNDVEEGGATRFNDIAGDDTMVHIDVIPRKGTALIWPSVLNDYPNDAIDERTFHEALEVTKGVKYGANAWLHLRRYKSRDDKCDHDAFDEILHKRKSLERMITSVE